MAAVVAAGIREGTMKKLAKVVTVRDAMMEKHLAGMAQAERTVQSPEQPVVPAGLDPRIGVLVRKGRTVFYATINGVHTEGDVDSLLVQMHEAARDEVARLARVSTYTITTLRPAPSMNEDSEEFTGRYVDAVIRAQDLHRQTGRTTRVCTGTYWWHCCCNMVATDRNTNSGVPEVAAIIPADLLGPMLSDGGAL